jgi:outer membrane protein TolC
MTSAGTNKKASKRKNTNCLYWVMMIASCIIGQALQAQQGSMNIKQAIDIALGNNYGLWADSLNMTVTKYQNKQLSGSYLPQVSYSSKINYNMAIPSQMLPGAVAGQPSKDYIPVQFGTKYDATSGIQVTQNIYRKDLLLQIRAEDLNSSIAQTKYKLTKEDLIYKVAAAFYNLESSAENIRTTTDDYKNLKNVLEIAKQQFENGTLKRIEYESLQISVANKQSLLSQYRTQYDEQLYYFKYLLGIPADASVSINDIISLLPEVKIAGENSFLQREDIHLAKQLIQSKEVEMKSIRAEGLPQVSSYFRYNYQSQLSNAGKFFDSYYWSNSSTVGLSLSVSIFDGNIRKNRVHVAQTQLQQLKWQHDYQQQQAQTELLSAVQKLNNNREQFNINSQNLVLAEKVFNSRRSLYTEGVTTLVELLDAETELTQARSLYIQSLINVQTGTLDVHKANGTLLTEFLKTL